MKMRLTLIMVALLCVAGIVAGQQRKETPTGKQPVQVHGNAVSFKKDVAPVLKKYCLPCHTEDQMNPSELYLDSHANLVSGGKHGPAAIPGKPDSSLLIRKFDDKPSFGDRMPLKRKTPFPADTLAILKAWIRQGAKND